MIDEKFTQKHKSFFNYQRLGVCTFEYFVAKRDYSSLLNLSHSSELIQSEETIEQCRFVEKELTAYLQQHPQLLWMHEAKQGSIINLV